MEDNVRDLLSDKVNLGQHYTAVEKGRYTKAASSVKHLKEALTTHATGKTCAAIWLPAWDLYCKKDVN